MKIMLRGIFECKWKMASEWRTDQFKLLGYDGSSPVIAKEYKSFDKTFVLNEICFVRNR
ncbi:MAG: hypothetical protein ACERKZ_17700 [Lachnotalea sp.]